MLVKLQVTIIILYTIFDFGGVRIYANFIGSDLSNISVNLTSLICCLAIKPLDLNYTWKRPSALFNVSISYFALAKKAGEGIDFA